MSGSLAFVLEEVRFDERGLVPVVAQDVTSGAVLMVAWADRAALAETARTGQACFFSRSRQRRWRKGETSGNTLDVVAGRLDCDGDTVLLRVVPRGPACHTGSRSCFPPEEAALELGWLYAVLEERRRASGEESYTARLLAAGPERVAQKVGEEATETVIAALSGDPAVAATLADEAADLLYHLLVLLLDRGVPLRAVAEVLEARHREKAAMVSSRDSAVSGEEM